MPTRVMDSKEEDAVINTTTATMSESSRPWPRAWGHPIIPWPQRSSPCPSMQSL